MDELLSPPPASAPFEDAVFTYNGDGRRVKSVNNGAETTYFVGAHYEVAEREAGTQVTKYYYAGTQRIAMRTGTVLSYLLSDHLGSTSLTVDAVGNVISEQRYTAWGEVRFASGATPTMYTYTGQYSYTSDFGLMFYNARWYDPSLGRFNQADTIIPEQSQGVQAWDRYAYTNNNPVRYNDPTGHVIPFCVMCWYPENGYELFNYSDLHPVAQGVVGGLADAHLLALPIRNDAATSTIRTPTRISVATTSLLMMAGPDVLIPIMPFEGTLGGAAVSENAKVSESTARKFGDGPEDLKWGFGKTETKWAGQRATRGWTEEMVEDAVAANNGVPAYNKVNQGNTATLYTHPETGQMVVIDDVTHEVIAIGRKGFSYSDWIIPQEPREEPGGGQ